MKKITNYLLFIVTISVFFSCKNEHQPNHADEQETITYKHTDNKLRIRLPADPDRLNPVLTTSGYARIICDQVFLYLMDFDPNTMELVPQLAKAPPEIKVIKSGPNAGGMAYTYEILEDAVWPNGTPITGHDFDFTMKALFNPKVNSQPFRPYYDFVTEIEVDKTNPKKFTVFTNKKYIVAADVIGNSAVLPKYHYDPKGLLDKFSYKDLHDTKRAQVLVKKHPELTTFADAFNSSKYSHEPENIVGSGAYKVVEWKEKQQIRLKKIDNWWGNKYAKTNPTLAAFPDELIFLPIRDQATALTAVKDEILDLATSIHPHDFIELRKNKQINDIYNFYSPPSLTSYFIYINNKNPKLNDKRVRRALAHLVNVDELINTAVFGLGKQLTGIIPPTAPYFDKDLKPITFDIKKAKQLLAEAGWKDSNNNGIVDKVIDGETVELTLGYKMTKSSKLGKSIALLFQDNAKKAGVNIELVTKEFNVYRGDLRNRNYELASGGISSPPVIYDPKPFWHSQSDTPNGGNKTGFHTDECDKIIDEIRVTLDEDKRNQLYKRFQEIIYDEQPVIFLYTPLNRVITHKRFKAGIQSFGQGYHPGLFELIHPQKESK